MKRFNQHPRRAPVGTSWEKVAHWYGEHLKDEENLLNTVVYPAALAALGEQSGKHLLDIACGEGAFSRLAARAGAKVTGFDAAPSLIERAKKSAPSGAEYFVGDAQNFSFALKGKIFDAAACLLAVQNVKNFEKIFANASRLLAPGAPFVVVMNHPVFRVPRQSSWGWEETRKIQYRRIDAYMSPLDVPIVAHPGEKHSAKTFSYHRPLSSYINALGQNGFAVVEMSELVSDRQSDSGPRAKAENRARREIPMFLLVTAIKLK